ncbi:uncharacterized aarF domain-containing protein kinase 2 [Ochotona princeps]|uniref:uncharacterized aarF domain-containing protein kinase 2 n=1 Tax=Ochotona princeps TaxID=9978 RepID=UPI002714742E|nr:uncharacterized aarF domain-containing protein kinase 2 [Ochotona princeps]
MVAPWRLSVQVCLSRLRCFELRKELRPSGCARNTRLCWLLLGTLPKVISVNGDCGTGASGGLCQKKARWSGLAENVPTGERVSQAGSIGHIFLQVRVWLRACALLMKFFPLLLLYPLTYLAPGVSALWLRLLLKATETSGPTYIKLGQWASTRRDLFSQAFCAQFSKLHVQVAPHAWAHTERILQQAFGEHWASTLFFEHQEPVGSGCVAQVYKAYAHPALLAENSANPQPSPKAGALGALRQLFGHLGKGWKPPGNLADQLVLEKLLLPEAALVGPSAGRSEAPDPGLQWERDHLIPVAVKVLHPGLLSQVQMDLWLMKIGSRALDLLPGIKWFSLPEVVEEFEKLMVQQIDLRYEAHNLEHFQRNFRNVTSVKFPTPLRPFVTRDVLVETYEESVPVSSYQQVGIPGDLKRAIARLGINMLLKMIFVDNFVHADLHPGNILVQGAHRPSMSREVQPQQVAVFNTWMGPGTATQHPLRLVLLDAGIVAELSDADLSNFRAVFLAVVMGQGRRVAELILHHARASECRDVEGFKTEMAALVTQARRNTITLEKVHVSSLLSSVFKLLMTHRVKLESNFASIVFAIMVLEGLGRSLDPKLDILEAARPFLLKGPASSP